MKNNVEIDYNKIYCDDIGKKAKNSKDELEKPEVKYTGR